MSMDTAAYQRHLKKRAAKDFIFHKLMLLACIIAVGALVVLLVDIVRKGLPWLSWHFMTSFPSFMPKNAGILSALSGTLWVTALTALFAFPIGVATAIFLEEYAPKNRLMNVIDINIANLAGVPSIVYGILGLAAFVRAMALGRSILAGALTMTLLVLPVMIIAAREAIRSVPSSLRTAFLAMGATKWQTIWHIVIPASLPSIFTGAILTISRAIGETAPLILIGALSFVAFTPRTPMDGFTVLPIQIFSWISKPQEDFSHLAAAAIMVLLAVLLSMNAVSVWLRNKYEKRTRA
ncbi:MAG: phosphate ABC transporter, permease protein PstA [Candidatus Aquicultor secundus]|nr:phosphate ABC transporter permease PstA [Candidatus Aquicultor secundus]OIO86979.1 MAG: phosphate ABC transporter, permease protein PstA [Candidatus Aquicultor secundus]